MTNLIDNRGFDLWANNYDKDVNLSDGDKTLAGKLARAFSCL